MKKIIYIFILAFININFIYFYKTDKIIDNVIKDDNSIIIPAINLYTNFYSYKEKTVDEGIIYLKESNLKNNFIILAAHSGNSSISYFKSLYKLNYGDLIIVNNNSYIVNEIKYIKKNGKILLPKKENKHVLYLTTCDKFNKNRQLIIKCIEKL